MESTTRKPAWRLQPWPHRRLRTAIAPLLRHLDRPITITNPYTGLPLRLLGYSHKAYWLKRIHRNTATMRRMDKLVHMGDTVFEVGSNIGFTSQYFANRIGDNGQVHVFEARKQPPPLLQHNVARNHNCVLINSVIGNRIDATTTTLDHYAMQHGLYSDFIKINAAGRALPVLQGAPRMLSHCHAVVANITQDKQAIFDLLTASGFALSDENNLPILAASDMQGNVFAIRTPH